MKTSILATITNRGATKHTRRMWQAMLKAGAFHLEQEGSPDVAFARNLVLSVACKNLRNFPDRDMVLLCDDDMIAPLEHVQRLIDAARRTGKACSVVYPTQSAHLAGCRWRDKDGVPHRDPADGRTLWLVGMGCVAIPRALLLETEKKLPSYRFKDEVHTAFCQTGVIAGEWWAEDYQLSANLGGVRLEPIGFGHIKTTPLWPDQETLDQIAKDGPLPGEEKDLLHVRHHDQLFPGEETSPAQVSWVDKSKGAS